MIEPRVPPELLSAVTRDLRRVRPLATPGRRALSLLPIGIVLLVGMPIFWSWYISSGPLAPWPSWALSALETNLTWIRECIGMATAFSIPALAVVGWLVARALPHRPALTGALCGLGVGMMTDAGLRLFCRDGALAHIVVAHGGAIIIVVALGALGASVVERIKARG